MIARSGSRRPEDPRAPLGVEPHEHELLDDGSKPREVTVADARGFLVALAERLCLAPRHVFAAYEDAFYYAWRERKLPVNVDPLDSRLEDKGERLRLTRLFEQGLEAVVGHVLPVAREWS